MLLHHSSRQNVHVRRRPTSQLGDQDKSSLARCPLALHLLAQPETARGEDDRKQPPNDHASANSCCFRWCVPSCSLVHLHVSSRPPPASPRPRSSRPS